MRKLLTLITALVLIFALCATAGAARQKFANFSLDVPDGWTATEHTDDKGNKTTILSKGDTTAMLGLEPLEGKTVKQKAEELAGKVNGKVEDLGDDDWGVAFTGQDGKEVHTILTDVGDGRFLGIAIIGSSADEVLEILDSIEE